MFEEVSSFIQAFCFCYSFWASYLVCLTNLLLCFVCLFVFAHLFLVKFISLSSCIMKLTGAATTVFAALNYRYEYWERMYNCQSDCITFELTDKMHDAYVRRNDIYCQCKCTICTFRFWWAYVTRNVWLKHIFILYKVTS